MIIYIRNFLVSWSSRCDDFSESNDIIVLVFFYADIMSSIASSLSILFLTLVALSDKSTG
jgi:hypothetical protein